jgi:hypothetical protein
MNTRTLWIGAAVLVLAAGCNRNRDTSTGSLQDQANVTLTGCLQAGEQGLAREPNAAAGSAENIDQFVLANAKTPGAPVASNEAPSPLYVLEGKADELRQHVGHQVEIMGDPEDSSTDPSRGNARRIEVDSVRMIAATCVTP